MIIQCEECKTRFRLDDSKISEAGVRVRCSRCTHTFVVRRDVPEEEQDFDVILQGLGDATNTREEADESVDASNVPAAQGVTEGVDATSPEPETREPQVGAEEPGSCECEGVQKGEGTVDESFADLFENGEETSNFQFQGDGAGEAWDVEDPVSPASDGPAIAGEGPSGEAAPAAGAEEVPPPVAEEIVPPSLEPEKVDAANPQVHGQVRWPIADGDTEAEEDEMPPLSIASRRKGTRLLTVLLGILLVLVLGAAGYYLMQGSAGNPLVMLRDRVNRIIGTGNASPAAAVRSLEGEFISNREAGELFVMRGEVVNSSEKPVTTLRVRGTVYGADGKELAQRTVFCGNTLSREQLAFQPYSSMEKLMGRQFGDTLANLEVLPGKAVPFLIVFRNVPKGASDFGAVVFGAAGQ